MIKILHKIYSRWILLIRGNRLITYFLFGFAPKNYIYKQYWDWTTLEMKKSLKKIYKHNSNILDMGTGPYAILAIYAKNVLDCSKVTGADFCKELIENAMQYKSTEYIQLIHTDLFEQISDHYDIILFNAPYIDEVFGKNLGILNSELTKRRWSGGIKGIQTIERFLSESKNHLTSEGIIILGVNNFYVDNKLMEEIIKNKGFFMLNRYSNKLTKACAYVLKIGDNHDSL